MSIVDNQLAQVCKREMEVVVEDGVVHMPSDQHNPDTSQSLSLRPMYLAFNCTSVVPLGVQLALKLGESEPHGSTRCAIANGDIRGQARQIK